MQTLGYVSQKTKRLAQATAGVRGMRQNNTSYYFIIIIIILLLLLSLLLFLFINIAVVQATVRPGWRLVVLSERTPHAQKID